MRIFLLLLALLPLLAARAAVADDDGGAPAAIQVVAPVTVTPAVRHSFVATASGFGTVQAPPQNAVTLTATHAGVLGALFVRAGQTVTRGERLFTLGLTPSAGLAYRKALNAYSLALGELQRVERLYSEHLATNSDLAKARAALADADAALAAQRRSGAGRATETVAAPFDGTVTRLSAGEGSQVSQGAPVLTLARGNHLSVRLGVEPDEVARIHPGMPATLAPTYDANATSPGTVETVSGVIDPKTRLVDVSVRLAPQGAPPLIGTFMEGRIRLGAETVLAVPRSAVLADAKGSYVFVVAKGHARRVAVTPGQEQDGLVAVAGDLKPGQPVVSLGNYELQDGMAVEVVGRRGGNP